jgi:fatty acid desaturase
MRLRKELLRQSAKNEKSASLASKSQMAMALALHAGLIAAFFKLGFEYLAVAWIAGTGLFLPFFTALRQLLEHRSDAADQHADYSQIAHGEVTRMFSPGLLGSTLGGAGFNRHLLHHWDPQVSYTRLPELEQFLLATTASSAICAKESYFGTFKRLFGK